MEKNCDLELRLFPSSDDFVKQDQEQVENPQRKMMMMTIFYNGRVCACDVTESQARAILLLASGGEMENRLRDNINATPSSAASRIASPTTFASNYNNNQSDPVYSPPAAGNVNGTISMKRSLQRFLQKRKTRIESTSPYFNSSNINRFQVQQDTTLLSSFMC